jgi:hypothetical protein
MMLPVRWFFWLPCSLFFLFSLAMVSASASALVDSDFSRCAVLALIALLGASGCASCGIVAAGGSV